MNLFVWVISLLWLLCGVGMLALVAYGTWDGIKQLLSRMS